MTGFRVAYSGAQVKTKNPLMASRSMSPRVPCHSMTFVCTIRRKVVSLAIVEVVNRVSVVVEVSRCCDPLGQIGGARVRLERCFYARKPVANVSYWDQQSARDVFCLIFFFRLANNLLFAPEVRKAVREWLGGERSAAFAGLGRSTTYLPICMSSYREKHRVRRFTRQCGPGHGAYYSPARRWCVQGGVRSWRPGGGVDGHITMHETKCEGDEAVWSLALTAKACHVGTPL